MLAEVMVLSKKDFTFDATNKKSSSYRHQYDRG